MDWPPAAPRTHPPPFCFLGTNVFSITRPCRAWQPGARGAVGDAMLAPLAGPSPPRAARQFHTLARPRPPPPPPAATPGQAGSAAPRARHPGRSGGAGGIPPHVSGGGGGGQALSCSCCQLRAPVPPAGRMPPQRLRGTAPDIAANSEPQPLAARENSWGKAEAGGRAPRGGAVMPPARSAPRFV